MIGRPPGTARVVATLALAALRRTLRAAQVAGALRAQRRAASSGRRAATPRRGGFGLTLLMVAMMPVMLFNAVQLTGRGVEALAEAALRQGHDVLVVRPVLYEVLAGLEPARLAAAGDAQRTQAVVHDAEERLRLCAGRRGVGDVPHLAERFAARGLAGFAAESHELTVLATPRDWTDRAALGTFTKAVAMLLLGITVMLFAVSIGGANLDLGRADWSFPWLLTFPVPTRAVVLAKVLEYALVSFFPWFMVFPLVWQVLRATRVPGAPWLAVAATLGTTAALGALRFLAETWMRLRLPLQRIRSIQATCTLIGLVSMAAVFTMVMRQPPDWFLDAAAAAPGWLTWLGTAWPAAAGRHGAFAAPLGLTLLLSIGALATGATVRLLQRGAERSGGVDPGTRGATAAGSVAAASGGLGLLRKELLLLARDRNFAVQTLVVPLVVLGLQLLLNPGAAAAAQSPGGNTTVILCYLIGMLAVTGGCFSVLSNEGRALWLLYCQPLSLHRALRQKVLLWASIAVVYAGGGLLVVSLLRPEQVSPLQRLGDAFCVLAGVFSAAWLAAGIGTLGTEPAADHVPRQPKQRHIYLYFYLAGTYCVGLANDQIAVRAAALLVFGTLAWSLWQRVGDRIPWLLDPTVRGPRALSAYDAGAAVTTFFLLQGTITMVAAFARARDPGFVLLIAYAVAGAVTVLVFGLVLVARRLPVRDLLGLTTAGRERPWLAVAVAAPIGAALGALGLGWQHVVEANGWIDPAAVPLPGNRVTIGILAVVAAPICEEILFRGLLFQSLRRSVPTWLAAVWSALLFTVVHPFAGWPMVCLVGLATAILVARTRFLPAAMLLHAVYNLVLVLAT